MCWLRPSAVIYKLFTLVALAMDRNGTTHSALSASVPATGLAYKEEVLIAHVDFW